MTRRSSTNRISILPLLSKLNEIESSLPVIRPSMRVVQVLRGITETANEILGGHFAVVQPYDQKSDKFLVDQFTAGGDARATRFKWTYPRPTGAARTALNKGLLKIEDYSKAKYKFIATRPEGAFREVAETNAALGIRLEAGDERVGVLFVNYPTPHHFTREEIQIAKFFATQAANAIHNGRAFERERRARQLAETLEKISRILTVPHDLQTVLELILEAIQEVVRYDYALVGLIEDDCLVSHAAIGFPQNEAVLDFRLSIGEDQIFRKMTQTRLPVIIPDVRNSDWKCPPSAEATRTWLGVPLLTEEKIIGQIGLYSKRADHYTENESTVMLAFANQVSVAIESARLNEVARKHTDDLEKLLSIANNLTGSMTEPEKVLNIALRDAVRLVNSTRGAIVLREQDEGRLVSAYDMRDPDKRPDVGIRFADSELQKKIRQSPRPIFISDVAKNEILTARERQLFLERGIKSTAIMPLIARGDVLGSLGIDDCNRHRNFESEKGILQILADLVATSIDNARLYGVAEKELASVIEVTRNILNTALHQDISLNEFFEYVIEQTLSLLQFNAGWLLLKEGDNLRIIATDKEHDSDRNRVFALPDSVSGQSILKNQAINIPNLAEMPDEYRLVYKAPRGGQVKSELAVPLLIAGEAIGAFNIESERLEAFEPRHEQMIQLLGEQVALAIQLAQIREENADLISLGTDLSQRTEMSEVVRLVLDHARERISSEFGQVLLKEGEDLVVRYTTNVPPLDLNRPYPIGNCISGLAVDERKPILVPDISHPDYYVADWKERSLSSTGNLIQKKTENLIYQRALGKERESVVAEYALPLLNDGVIIGVLNLETSNSEGFTPKQREDVLQYIESKYQDFAMILVSGNKQNLEELLRGATSRANTAFCQILRLEDNELVIVHTTGSEPVDTRVPVGGSVTGRVVRKQSIEYVPDVSKDPDYKRFLGEDMKSELVVPLIVGDQVIGVINLESPTPAFFTIEHARRLANFGELAAVAIDRARSAESKAFAQIGGLAGDIVHSLNNPLGAMGKWIQLFKEKKDIYPIVTQQYPYVETFVGRMERELGTANSYVRKLRKELIGAEVHPMSLKSVVNEARQMVLHYVKEELPEDVEALEKIAFALALQDESDQVMATDRLVNVFWNLFDNARKSMPSGGNISVTSRLSSDGQWVVIDVQDQGPGIDPWRRSLIFDPTESTTQDAHAPVHGMGLWWTKNQIENFGGSIEVVESQDRKGTCMRVKLRH